MIGVAMFSCAVGIVFGGAIVFGTISWIKEHVSTFEDASGKYGVLTTDRVLFSVKMR
jgi:hypothetical protein